MLPLILLLTALAATGVSLVLDPSRTRKGLVTAARSLWGITPSMLGVVGLVGLMLAVVGPETIRSLFNVHGLKGFVLVSLIGTLLTIPAPVAFPLAGSLRDMGAGLPELAAFLTTLTMVGLLTAPLEVAAFGRRFTVLRQSLSFMCAVGVGLAMGMLL